MKKSRYFTHFRGFGEGTKYIEVRPDVSILHSYYGEKTVSWWPLEECLRLVKNGHFKEIPDPKIKKPAPKTQRRWRKIDGKTVRVTFKGRSTGVIYRRTLNDINMDLDHSDAIRVEILS